MLTTRSFWLKFFEALCLIVVIIGLTQTSEAITRWQFEVVNNWSKSLPMLAGMLVVSFGIAYAWERSGKGNQLHGLFQAIIAFYVAYSVTGYGAAKILKTQFQPPNYVLETPIKELSGFWLTWTYYGYSQTMAYILGWTQILGCILLLFRRTRLIGVFVLLPVMVNIDLIDHFYEISPLAYYNALHYTFLLFFLLALEYDKLKIAFLSYQEKISLNGKTVLINIVRVLVIGLSFWRIASLRDSFEPKTKLNGVWQVETMSRNNKAVSTAVASDLAWSKLYFEWRYGCLFKYNPDKFQKKDLHGMYKLDEKSKRLSVDFPKENGAPGDSLRVTYKLLNDSTLTMQGRYKQDSLTMKLRKLI
ncbi:hypothetical protein GO755_35530 [Spirosoma sp. HMF4905]|uniref:DoxX family protein n=1 Tax=Spirosoma arboris TaxID=2682092 RepID=A0A7K1SNP6_9BACT|nr:hypothetical protein [Spirosoma arboris]MVM35387.1 hypothetical protein [Spirosoma arboris]